MAAQLGILTIPSGTSRNAPPSNEDIARAVVATLLDPAAHAGATYRPTGPALIDAREMAQILTDVLSRRVRHVDLPVWAFMAALKVIGSSLRLRPVPADGRSSILLRTEGPHLGDRGPDNSRTRPHRPRTGGHHHHRPPLRHPARRHRTPTRLARSLLDMARIGMVLPPRLDRFVTLQQHPLPATPSLSVHSAPWLAEHDTVSTVEAQLSAVASTPES